MHGFVNCDYSAFSSYWYILFKLELLLSQEMGGGTKFFKGGPYFSEKNGPNFVEIFGPGGHFMGDQVLCDMLSD